MFRIFFCLTALGVASAVPKFLTCDRGDSKCLTSLIQAMYKTGIESSIGADPMFQERITATLPTLNFTITNTTIEGFKKCQIKDASVLHCDKSTLSILMCCPLFYLTGQYEADGSIETIPFFGKGGFNLNTTDYEIRIYPKIKITEKDSRKYMKIVDFDEDLDLKGELDFNLENLYNGNAKLSEATHKFMKANPKFMAEYLQKPLFDANIQKVVDLFNKAFENIPINGFIV